MKINEMKKGHIYVAKAQNKHLFKFDRITEYGMVLCSGEIIYSKYSYWVYAGKGGSINMYLTDLEYLRKATFAERCTLRWNIFKKKILHLKLSKR